MILAWIILKITLLKSRKNNARLNMKNVKENATAATPASVNGMGAPALPGNPGTQAGFVTQKTGSGDIPYSLVKGQPKKKKKIFVQEI